MTFGTSAPDRAPHGRRLVLAAATALTAATLLGTALSPYLLAEHPLALIALNPSGGHLVLVANHVDPWHAMVVGALRRGLSFVVVFALASAYSDKVAGWLEGKPAWLVRAAGAMETMCARAGAWLVILAPTYPVAVFAGMARMRWRTFVIALVPGQVAVVMGAQRFGEVIEAWTEPIVGFVTGHSLALTFAATALVAAQQTWSRWCARDRLVAR